MSLSEQPRSIGAAVGIVIALLGALAFGAMFAKPEISVSIDGEVLEEAAAVSWDDTMEDLKSAPWVTSHFQWYTLDACGPRGPRCAQTWTRSTEHAEEVYHYVPCEIDPRKPGGYEDMVKLEAWPDDYHLGTTAPVLFVCDDVMGCVPYPLGFTRLDSGTTFQ